MRRLAGSLIYFFVALILVYAASWTLFLKTDARNLKTPLKGGVLAKFTLRISPTPFLTSTPTLKPTFTPTPSPKPTPTPIPTQKPTPTSTPTPRPTIVPTVIPTPTVTKSTSPTTVPTSSVTNSLLDKVNEFRSSKGLGKVSSNSETCSFASTRAGEISSNFNHDGFTSRISSHTLPYPNYKEVTENIAMTTKSEDVINMWINSSTHAENMLKDTPFVCIAQNGDYYAYEGWRP
jgi:uncharacterized protein YkwD